MILKTCPCSTCPYRRDVPSAIWHESEYLKLLPYDLDTAEQPQAMFICHSSPADVCRGWFETHGWELLAIRLASIKGRLDLSAVEPCPVECFASGREAAEHGMRDIDEPGKLALQAIGRLETRSKNRE